VTPDVPDHQRISLSQPDDMWPLPLDVRYIDGDDWMIINPFVFNSPSPEFPSVTLPAGFVTDFASIPRFFWRIMHPTHKHIGKIAVVHDLYYRIGTIDVSRDRADVALRSGMKALGANRVRRNAAYWAVRAGGRRAFQPRVEVIGV
jgi:hypothetical protein